MSRFVFRIIGHVMPTSFHHHKFTPIQALKYDAGSFSALSIQSTAVHQR